jgi:hypothetical protein
VILPDHDFNAAFPVLPLCGDGLQPRSQNESSVFHLRVNPTLKH